MKRRLGLVPAKHKKFKTKKAYNEWYFSHPKVQKRKTELSEGYKQRKHDIDKLLKNLGRIFKQLEDDKVINSSRFTGDIGEYLVRKKLSLDEVRGEKGVDAKKGKIRYQIKTRTTIFNQNPKALGDFHNFNFDYCLRAVLNNKFQIKEIWQLPVKVVKKHCKNGKMVRFGFSKKVEKERGVKRIYPSKRVSILKS